MLSPRAFSLILFSLVFVVGFVSFLLPTNRRTPLVFLLTLFSLGVGIITQVMFWLALMFPGKLSLIKIMLVCTVISFLGLWLSRKRAPSWSFSDWRLLKQPVRMPGGRFLGSGILIVSGCILFDAVYWPFVDWDSLAIYGPLAKRIHQTGTLPDDSLYSGYPMLVPLIYAFTHWAIGGVNEYLAKLMPALLGIGGIFASVALGREVSSPKTGILAGFVTAATPFYSRWASSGYTDVPTAFYYVMCALFAWRWRNRLDWRDALLTGVMAGLALWTKSSALCLVVTLSLISFSILRNRTAERGIGIYRAQRRQIILMYGALFLFAAPWYLRNIFVFHTLIPPTIWMEQARRSAVSLLVMLSPESGFGLAGWLYLAALLIGSMRLMRGGWRSGTAWSLLMKFVIPFFLIWWCLASYDERFLVTIVPLLGVMGALTIEEVGEYLNPRFSPEMSRAATSSSVILAAVYLLFVVNGAVDGKRAILENPWMDDQEKHQLRLGRVYKLARAINQLPRGSNVIGVHPLAMYHIDLESLGTISEAEPDAPPWLYATSFDYVIYLDKGTEVPVWNAPTGLIFESEGEFLIYSSTRDAGVSPGSTTG